MGTADIPDLRSHTVAWFRSRQDVRAAENALERHGIESSYIAVARPDVGDNRREIDRRTWSALGLRAVLGVAVGAVIGSAIGLLVGLALGNTGADLWGFVLAGWIAGGPLGAIYMVGTRLPTQSRVFDTFGGEQVEDDGPMWIAVSGPDDVQAEAVRVLQSRHPVRVQGHAA